MTYYLLSELKRLLHEQHAQWSACAEPLRPGHFRLYNKNAGTTFHVRPIAQAFDHCAWIVACDEPVPSYFQHILQASE